MLEDLFCLVSGACVFLPFETILPEFRTSDIQCFHLSWTAMGMGKGNTILLLHHGLQGFTWSGLCQPPWLHLVSLSSWLLNSLVPWTHWTYAQLRASHAWFPLPWMVFPSNIFQGCLLPIFQVSFEKPSFLPNPKLLPIPSHSLFPDLLFIYLWHLSLSCWFVCCLSLPPGYKTLCRDLIFPIYCW